MSTSGSKSNEHVAHFLVDIHSKRVQKVKIYFNFVDDVEIPVISEPVVAKSTLGRRKTA